MKKKSTPGEMFFGFVILALIVAGIAKCSSGSSSGGPNSGQTVQEYCDSQYPNTSEQNYEDNIKCLHDNGV